MKGYRMIIQAIRLRVYSCLSTSLTHIIWGLWLDATRWSDKVLEMCEICPAPYRTICNILTL